MGRLSANDRVAVLSFFGDVVRMNRLGAMLYGLELVIIVLLFARETFEPATWLFKESDKVALAFTGWSIATLGPVALSMCVLLAAPRLKAQWLFHLLFMPVAIIMFTQGSLLFFYGANVSGDNSPEGYALLMGAAFLSLTIFVHAIAAIAQGFRIITLRVKDS
jgi:hypothetical protein